MMKKLVLLLLNYCIVSAVVAQNNQAVLDYIEQYKNIAMEEMQRTGVPAAITLAQGINESQAGQSTLAVETNNHFGIKCKLDWTGAVFYYDDDAKDECFRSYPCVEDSYRDHSDFLATRPNYVSLFTLDPLDYKAWCYGLKRAGYATSSSYATALIKTIEVYNLQQYSELALNKAQTENNNLVNVDENNNSGQDDVKQAEENETVANETTAEETTASVETIMANKQQTVSSYPTGIFSINNTRVLYAKAGESLFAIAVNNNIAYKKLLEFNELNNEDILQQNMLIYLERKPKRGATFYHVADSDESLKDISQTEGVQLQSILEYNNIPAYKKPAAGQKIYLQQQITKRPGR